MNDFLKKYRGFLTAFDEAEFAKRFADDYNSVLDYANGKDFEDCPFEMKFYNWIYGIEQTPRTNCGKRKKFVSIRIGYNMFCGKHCDCMKAYNKSKRESTCLEKYGVDNYSKTKECHQKMKDTFMERYGVEHSSQLQSVVEKKKATCLERYGVEHSSKSSEIIKKMKNTKLERYGDENYVNDEKRKATNLERYGVENVFQNGIIRDKFKAKNLSLYGKEYHINTDKTKETNMKRYGVEWCCMRKEARVHSNDSAPNKEFAELLDSYSISYEREFPLCGYSFDFKIGNTLVEINPAITHNTEIGLYNDKPKSFDYHLSKTRAAIDSGFRCVHVWDWDDKNLVARMLAEKKVLYARSLSVRIVKKCEAELFFSENHLQGHCRGGSVVVGLYDSFGNLAESMMFGKPRYSKKYDYELLRLCTRAGYAVVGGANRIFSYFLKTYSPKSVISYCDFSKFNGVVYNDMGFSLVRKTSPSCHWYDGKRHITEKLLLLNGADRLLGTGFGKHTDNHRIMLNNGFLPIYDCGQLVYVWNHDE